jgi:hypothetical protein
MLLCCTSRLKHSNLFRSLCWSIPLVLLPAVGVRGQETSDSSVWHVPQADLRIHIEKDNTQSMVPSLSLLDVMPDKSSESVAKWVKKNRWIKKYRVNGKLCLNVLPVLNAKPITYNLHRDVGTFVVRGIVIDDADPNTSVRFQVLTDKRSLYMSDPVTVLNPVAEIYVTIPPQSKQLKLVIKSRKNQHLSAVKWVDPGVILKRQYPVASSVSLCAPGYDLEALVPHIVLPSDGSKVMSKVLHVGPGDPMEVIFDSSKRNPSYWVYLVPKDRQTAPRDTWQAQAGLILETKWTKNRLRSSDRLPEFMDTFDSRAERVGQSLVDDIQQTFPIHWHAHGTDTPLARGGYGLYHFQGHFFVNKGGTYRFATVSNWDSYVTIDDTEVVAWPGRHDMRGGTRGQKQGAVTLTPGLHKLAYFNYSPWGSMYSLVAWQKPKESLRPMTRTDFISVGQYTPAAITLRESEQPYTAFAWSIVDDFRIEQTGPCLVTMQFKVLTPPSMQERYRWTFDDGTVATGRTVNHVFLRPALRPVKLEVLSEKKTVSRVVQNVHVHSQWDKMLRGLDNSDAYDQVIEQRNLDTVPINDTINVYRLADQARQHDWKNRATETLKRNLTTLVRDADDTRFLLDFGHTLTTARHKDYQKAVALYGLLAQKTGASNQVRRQAAICQAETLITYQGKAREALELIKQWQGAASRDAWRRREVSARAEALLAMDKTHEANELIGGLSASDSASAKNRIKQAGLLRHARALVAGPSDPNQLEHARSMIQTILTDDPALVFGPHLNLVKIDLYLAGQEYQAAYFLTARLRHLQLDDYHRAELLLRQIKACCGLRDLVNAREGYTDLKRDYPLHAALDQAKQAIIETFGK